MATTKKKIARAADKRPGKKGLGASKTVRKSASAKAANRSKIAVKTATAKSHSHARSAASERKIAAAFAAPELKSAATNAARRKAAEKTTFRSKTAAIALPLTDPATTKGAKAERKPKKAAARRDAAANFTSDNRKPKKTTPRSKSTAKSSAGGASSTRGKLNVIRPSGQIEDNFFELVHEVARQVPKGRVTSYGAIARALGTGRSARMVGWAMNVCHSSKRPVPAHRVVNSSGLLTGRHHFNPPEKMQQLLEKEGTKVIDNKVVDFKTKFWDPAGEL